MSELLRYWSEWMARVSLFGSRVAVTGRTPGAIDPRLNPRRLMQRGAETHVRAETEAHVSLPVTVRRFLHHEAERLFRRICAENRGEEQQKFRHNKE